MRRANSKKLRRRALAAVTISAVMGLSLAACAPSTQASEQAGTGDAAAQLSTRQATYPTKEGLEGVLDALQEKADIYTPEVRTLEDGTQIQRTPDSVFNQSGLAQVPSTYNITVLNADNRGCDSCHVDGLGKLVETMEFPHWPITNGLDTNITVEDCMYCHDETQGRDGVVPFSQLIHGIHSKESFNGDCMSCHAPASDTREGLSLWDAVKHNEMRGIVDVEDVEGNFSFDQDTLLGDTSVFRDDPYAEEDWGVQYDWLPNAAYGNQEPSQEDFDNWEFTVSGMVNEPYTITLGELIEEAPVEEFTSKLNCMLTAPSGTMIGNYKVKGIPMQYLIDKAGGAQEGAQAVAPYWGDSMGAPSYNFSLEDLARDGGWLVYEINGRPLTMAEGWPIRAWFPQHGAYLSARWCSGMDLTPEADGAYYEGFEYGDVDARGNEFGWRRMFAHKDYTQLTADKPVVSVSHTPEGKVIPVGQEYTFEGYADAWNDPVVALEFSMDGGETWTRYDTPDTDPIAWVWWKFGYTPEEPGGYVLKIRGITESGVVSELGDEVMVVAK